MSLKKIKNHQILLHIIIFLLVFGPKIGDILPVSVIISIIIIIYFQLKNGKLIITKDMQNFLALLMVIIIYSLLVSIFNNKIDFIFYGRLVRALFSFFSIYLLISSNNSKYNKEFYLDCLINVLFIQALIIIISSTIRTDWQNSLSWFSGYDKKIRYLRSSGLLSGFDMAGVVNNIGILLCLYKKDFHLIKFICFFIATLFTSRFSLLLLAVNLVLYLIFLHKEKGIKIFISLVGVVVGFLFAVVFLLKTTDIGQEILMPFENIFPLVNKFVNSAAVAYHQSSLEIAMERHWSLSDNVIEVFFGNGTYDGSDSGYILMINAVGLFGLCGIIFWHIYFLKRVFFKSKTRKLYPNNLYVVTLFIIIVLILNLKNCYYFTSTFFELFIFIIFSISYQPKIKGD